jgi:hypothetical protein
MIKGEQILVSMADKKKWERLENMHFHKMHPEDGMPNWQGRILKVLSPTELEVTLYSWMSGGETGVEWLTDVDQEIDQYRFYTTCDEMNRAYADSEAGEIRAKKHARRYREEEKTDLSLVSWPQNSELVRTTQN